MSGRGQRVSWGHPADLLQDLCCQQPPRAPGERLFAALAPARDAPAHQRAGFPSVAAGPPFLLRAGAGQTLLCLVLHSLDRSAFVGCLLLP